MEVHAVIASAGKIERRVLVVPNGVVTIGRSPNCTIALDSSLVSRQHVTIDLNGSTMRVQDSSTNGTMAGTKIVNNGTADVAMGIPLTVGEYTIALSVRPSAPAAHVVAAPAVGANVPAPANANGEAARPFVQQRLPSTPPPGPPTPEAGPPEAREGRGEHGTNRAPREAAKARAAEQAEEAYRREAVALRREIHRMLLEHLDLTTVEPSKLDDPSLRPKVLNALRRIVKTLDDRIPPDVNRDALVGEMVDEALGLGPLENFLSD